jgi:hypothetical protein
MDGTGGNLPCSVPLLGCLKFHHQVTRPEHRGPLLACLSAGCFVARPGKYGDPSRSALFASRHRMQGVDGRDVARDEPGKPGLGRVVVFWVILEMRCAVWGTTGHISGGSPPETSMAGVPRVVQRATGTTPWRLQRSPTPPHTAAPTQAAGPTPVRPRED